METATGPCWAIAAAMADSELPTKVLEDTLVTTFEAENLHVDF
jgi:hypothetical protein